MTDDEPVAVAEADQRAERLQEAGAQFVQLGESLAGSGITLTDVMLAIDSMGYERVGDFLGETRDLRPLERRAVVKRSRVYWQRQPLVDRSVGLWTDFAFAYPWKVTANDEAFQAVIDETMAAKPNRRVFSQEGMALSSETLLVDGERWFAYYTKPGSKYVTVRTFDSMEMLDPLTNPEDRDEIWYHVRRWTDLEGQQHLRVYRDWDFVDEDGAPRSDPHPALRAGGRVHQSVAGMVDADLAPVPGVYVSYLRINTLGLRGLPKGAAALDSVYSHAEFVRDRATLNAAAAAFAAKATSRGGARSVEQLRSMVEGPSPLRPEEGGRRARGAVFVTNEGADYENLPGRSDGASAMNDQRSLRQMAIAPFGIPDYFFDVATGNLATAQALTEPLRRQFVRYQGLWMTWLTEFCEHLAGWTGHRGDVGVDIDAPAIFPPSPTDFLQAVASACVAFPALKRSRALVELVLTELGVNHVDDEMSELEPHLDDEPEPTDPAAQAALEALREAARARREKAA